MIKCKHDLIVCVPEILQILKLFNFCYFFFIFNLKKLSNLFLSCVNAKLKSKNSIGHRFFIFGNEFIESCFRC